MIIEIDRNDKDKSSDCVKEVMLKVEKSGNTIWKKNSGGTIIAGAITDLAEGSGLLNTLPELPMDWTAVIGTITDDDQFGHTWDISKLWMGINWYCEKNRSLLLTEKNDKIVSYNSQKGAAVNYHEINSVDHSSIIGDYSLKAILLDILEKDGR